jgi:hypothetical protein
MSFDASSFLDASVTGQNDTKITPCPIGDYTGIIDKVNARQWTARDGTSSGVTLDVTWLIEDEGVKKELGRDTVTVRQGIMLDINAEGTGLDMGKGKNVGLGRLREALNMNKPGQAGLVSVSHRIDGEDVYSEIKKVGSL